MSTNIRIILILIGLILLALLGVVVTKKYERNPEEAEVLSPYVAIPIVLTIYYIYIVNFSFITYILSLGAIVLLFT
jgi:hypothetical protein